MAYEDLDDYSVGAAGSDTFDVVIPDLDPNTAYPIQFRWQFADKTVGQWSVSKILNTPEIERPESTNIVAQWVTIDNGIVLQITWDAPELANGFVVYLTAGATTVPFGHTLDKSKTEQKIIISAQDIRSSFAGVFETNFTGLLKTTYIDTSTSGSAFAVPPYSDPLSGAAILDTDWLITSVDKGISVSWNAIPTSGTYWETVVYKSSTQNGTYVAVGSARNAPVIVEEINAVWIKIRHRLTTGGYSAYSNAKEAQAYIPIVFDTTPPNELSGVSGAWSNDDIVVSYTMPASDPGARFEIILTNTGVSRTFFKWPSSQTGTGSVKITDSELFAQFGERYTSYTGVIKSIDGGENPTTGVSFTVATKSNPLDAITQAAINSSFTVTQISNGYTVVYTLPSGASYAKVYQGSTSGFTPSDATNLVYSGASPGVVINTTYSEVFIKIKYFAIDGSSSLSSAAKAVTPLEAGLLSLIDNEVKISTSGSILAGDSATSGGRAILNKTGLYIYNTGSSPTTQIIANATDGSPTLITTNAKIADWMIYESRIENTLHAGTTKYTGLSPSGTYAFWAGSTTSGGDASAKFSVTPEGAVIARNISVLGGTLSVGANFGVTSSGVLTATSSTVTGTINASAGVFKGQVDIGTGTEPSGVLRVSSGTGTILIGTNALINGTTTAAITASSGSTTNFYVRASDGYMFSQSGKIGGWDIGTSKLSGGGGASAVGLQIDSTAGGYAFWAGAGTPDTSTPFSVTNTGSLRATGAIISGNIKATTGFIGSANGTTATGFNFTATQITSVGTPSGSTAIVLDGSTGTVSGGLITGTKIVASSFEFTAGSDYLKSDGTFSLGGAAIVGSSTLLTINAGDIVLSAATSPDGSIASDENNYGGDPTLTINSRNQITKSRALHYGGTTVPGVNNTNRTYYYPDAPSTPVVVPFSVGDLWFTVN